MAVKEFKGIFKPSKAKHRVPQDMLTFITKDSFSLSQLLLLGALTQVAISIILPARYSLLPAVFFLLHNLLSTALQATSPERNTFLKGVIPGRTSAQLPNPSYTPSSSSSSATSDSNSTPLFGPRPASSPIVVLHLGVRLNHPLGPLSPSAMTVTRHFLACTQALAARAADFGCLGQSTWRAAERSSNNTLMAVFYFRSVEGLHAFAHDKVHREAWDWMVKAGKEEASAGGGKGAGPMHIGVFHETFAAMPGGYETVYLNMPPLLMGATNVAVRNEGTGEEEFVVPLVDADVPALRSQYGRMDRGADGRPVEGKA